MKRFQARGHISIVYQQAPIRLGNFILIQQNKRRQPAPVLREKMGEWIEELVLHPKKSCIPGPLVLREKEGVQKRVDPEEGGPLKDQPIALFAQHPFETQIGELL